MRPIPEGLTVGRYEEEGLAFTATDRYGRPLRFTTPADLRQLRVPDDVVPWNRAVLAFLFGDRWVSDGTVAERTGESEEATPTSGIYLRQTSCVMYWSNWTIQRLRPRRNAESLIQIAAAFPGRAGWPRRGI